MTGYHDKFYHVILYHDKIYHNKFYHNKFYHEKESPKTKLLELSFYFAALFSCSYDPQTVSLFLSDRCIKKLIR